MLLIHKDISHMPITELENDSESIWVKVFANKTSHFVASWYLPPGGNLEKLDSQLKWLESQLEKIKDIHKGNKPPSVHILGDFNFCDNVWPDRLSLTWNNLPSSVVEAPSVNSFKSRLNRHWTNHPSKFNPPCFIPHATGQIARYSQQCSNAPQEAEMA